MPLSKFIKPHPAAVVYGKRLGYSPRRVAHSDPDALTIHTAKHVLAALDCVRDEYKEDTHHPPL